MQRRMIGIGAAALGVLGLRAASAQAAKVHRMVFQVSVGDPATMNLILNNMYNAQAHYQGTGEALALELVAFGPGFAMLRGDTSPVKQRIAEMHEKLPRVIFSACENSRQALSRAENQDIPLLPQATPTPSGVVRIGELQEQGWSYIRT